MTRVHRVCAFALVSASLAILASAQTPALKINLGAWEVSTAIDVAGQLPGIDPSKMTPEQKARLDAMAKARAAQPPHVSKTCVTKENLQKNTFVADEDPELKCTQTIAANTPTALDATRTCTGESGSKTEHIHIEAPSPTIFKANINTTSTRSGRTMNVSAMITGKWLSADCK